MDQVLSAGLDVHKESIVAATAPQDDSNGIHAVTRMAWLAAPDRGFRLKQKLAVAVISPHIGLVRHKDIQ